MKIAFFMSTPFVLGGEQRVVSVVSNILIGKGHDVSIICTNTKCEENYDLYKLDKRVKIVKIHENGILRKIQNIIYKGIRKINRYTGIVKNNLKIQEHFWVEGNVKENLVKIINENDFDVVIGIAGYKSITLSMIKDKINAKVIGWQHNSFDAYFRNKNKYHYNQDIMFKKYIPNLDAYVVLTKQDKIKMKNELNVECVTIYNPKSFISEEVTPMNKKIFLAAGRFTYAKGFDMLIDSFAIFAKENKDWNLIFVGKGEEENKIQEKIEAYNLNDRIEMHGFTDNIQEYFLNSSCMLLPSRWEGMPMILLEAMEMGMPVIAYKIPVVEELLINEEDSLLVNMFDVEDYAKKMLQFANDEELRKKLAKNIKEKSKIFNYEKIGKEWDTILKNVKDNLN